MGHMRFEDTKPYEDWFWEKNRIDLIQSRVESIDFNSKTLSLDSENPMAYDKLILALGSKPNKFGWPGQDLQGVGGLYHIQDLERMESFSKGLQKAVVVGGGLIGIEMAEMFKSRNIDVSMIVRETDYWNNVLPAEESKMISKHIKEHHIDLNLGVNLGEIIDDGTGKASAVTIKETGERIECGFVGLTAGVSPNVHFLKDSNLEIERGIVVNNYLETNQKDVYAIGDCAQLSDPKPGRRNIEAVWYTGRMMGETVAYTITGTPIGYDPGIWFNSAKFLDIEYQVYGDVRNQIPEDQKTFYWEHADGNKSIRLNFEKESNIITGFNLMGIRFRHEVCEKWIKNRTHIDEVVSNLKLANFDPEFFRKNEAAFVSAFNKAFGKSLRLTSNGRLNKVLSFLKS